MRSPFPAGRRPPPTPIDLQGLQVGACACTVRLLACTAEPFTARLPSPAEGCPARQLLTPPQIANRVSRPRISSTSPASRAAGSSPSRITVSCRRVSAAAVHDCTCISRHARTSASRAVSPGWITWRSSHQRTRPDSWRRLDACAYRGALSAGGESFAVLAGGPDISYPGEHCGLLGAIAAHGAVISESPSGTRPARRVSCPGTG